MKKSTIAITLVWAYIVGTSVAQGFTLPSSDLAKVRWPIDLGYLGLFAAAFLPASAFFVKSVPGVELFGDRVDRRFGQGVYVEFMNRLKLELLFSCMSFSIGIVGLLRTMQVDGVRSALGICEFFIGCGVGFSPSILFPVGAVYMSVDPPNTFVEWTHNGGHHGRHSSMLSAPFRPIPANVSLQEP